MEIEKKQNKHLPSVPVRRILLLHPPQLDAHLPQKNVVADAGRVVPHRHVQFANFRVPLAHCVLTVVIRKREYLVELRTRRFFPHFRPFRYALTVRIRYAHQRVRIAWAVLQRQVQASHHLNQTTNIIVNFYLHQEKQSKREHLKLISVLLKGICVDNPRPSPGILEQLYLNYAFWSSSYVRLCG